MYSQTMILICDINTVLTMVQENNKPKHDLNSQTVNLTTYLNLKQTILYKKQNWKGMWRLRDNDGISLQDDVLCLQTLNLVHSNLLEVLSNCFRSLPVTHHTLCPERVNLLYSKLLSGYSLLPINKDFKELWLNDSSNWLWPCLFMI